MAEQHIRRAFDLNPNDTEVLIFKGRLLAARGRPEEALVCFEAAFRLNPLYQYSTGYNSLVGVALYSLRRFDEASHALKRVPRATSWSTARLAVFPIVSHTELGAVAEFQRWNLILAAQYCRQRAPQRTGDRSFRKGDQGRFTENHCRLVGIRS